MEKNEKSNKFKAGCISMKDFAREKETFEDDFETNQVAD